MKRRWYFWEYSEHYSWRQLGRGDGYETLKECQKDNYFYIKDSSKYEILLAKPIKSKV